MRCDTRYPIVLIHGAGFRDLSWPVYWGRIPGRLEYEGATIFYGLQDCWASVDTNAREIARRIDEIIAQTGCEKVNLIAHSKGGLDARRAAACYGCQDKIASITTIATPHHGSQIVDRLMRLPKPLWKTAAFFVNHWIQLVGDRQPDFLALCEGFTTEAAARFNRETPDVPEIFYQSFACRLHHPFSDLHLSTASFIVSLFEGDNDGLVAVESARWGERFRVLQSNGFRGLSHLDAIDLRRLPLTRKSGEDISDIFEFYVNLVEDLKQQGF